jgi:hypothetical protein
MPLRLESQSNPDPCAIYALWSNRRWPIPPPPHRQQDVLYILTLSTVCILPLQFLTGVFGMNFVNMDDGTAGDPLLNLGNQGYVLFWAIGISLTIISLFAFRHGQTVLRGTGNVANRISKAGHDAARKTSANLQASSSRLLHTSKSP